ncbi:uncharacterized protein LOC120695580 [Panicum virgatum]|uniref:Phorbol-ester/DAG-type domain-containing protein n=1 Tax=Panicum virgatum TaxID=38727 RepID=A0A8T0WDJ9_PANVG|nr:uncharacterized protein LOC120695580 [Panicum virgatum]KAG2646752.1 hypothetical protein PVAP13_2KG528700 [Panicum virgatum]
MAGAGATTTIRSSLFHSQHPLKQYHYAEGSAYSCDACELRVTGTGYSCDECNFDIHAACLGLPASISFAEHTQHRLELKALGPGASRRCDACGETSHAGAHVYHCATCEYNVHPRCTSLVAAPQQGGAERRRGSKRRAIKMGLKIGLLGLNILTGGTMSPVFDAIDTMFNGV